MKKPVILALATISLFLIIGAVYAPWSTLGTGYAITSNVHGVDIAPFTPVTVTAGSLDSSVTMVTFRWHRPDDSVAREVTVPVFTNGSTGQWNNGTIALIRYAIDTFNPPDLGDWGVQAFFQDSTGKDRANLQDVIAIKATSFNVIPEVPFGTAAIALSMFAALGLFVVKKKGLVPFKKPM